MRMQCIVGAQERPNLPCLVCIKSHICVVFIHVRQRLEPERKLRVTETPHALLLYIYSSYMYMYMYMYEILLHVCKFRVAKTFRVT